MTGLSLVYFLAAAMVGAVVVIAFRSRLTPALKQKVRGPLAYISGLMAFVSAGFAYINAEPGLYLSAAAMVGVVVSVLVAKRQQQQ